MSGSGHGLGLVASHSGRRHLVDVLLSARPPPPHSQAALLQASAPSTRLEKANLTFLNPEP